VGHTEEDEDTFATDGSESAVATAKLLAAMSFYDDFEITVLNVQRSAFYDIPERFAIEIDDRMKEAVADRRNRSLRKQRRYSKMQGIIFPASISTFSFLPNLGTQPPKYLQLRIRSRLTLSRSAAGG